MPLLKQMRHADYAGAIKKRASILDVRQAGVAKQMRYSIFLPRDV
jgi:hypothetical protein